MAIIIWIFVHNTEALLAPVQDQILTVLIVFNGITKKTTLFFSTQDKFLSPGSPYIFHNNILSPFQGYINYIYLSPRASPTAICFYPFGAGVANTSMPLAPCQLEEVTTKVMPAASRRNTKFEINQNNQKNK